MKYSHESLFLREMKDFSHEKNCLDVTDMSKAALVKGNSLLIQPCSTDYFLWVGTMELHCCYLYSNENET